MPNGTEPRDQALPHAAGHVSGGALSGAWEKVKTVFVRSLFWSYERGTLPYDLMVLAILAFIFLTPRSWFRDRPTLQLTDLRHSQGFVEVGHGNDGWRYLVDARLVESLGHQKPEDAIHEILRQHLQRRFTVKSIDAVRDKNNVILGYSVLVEQ